MKKRGVSYPFALVVDGDGKEKIVFANYFSEGKRPEDTPEFKDVDFLCPSCKGAMHWSVGPKKPNQPDSLFSDPVRGRPLFRHNPGQLNDHIVTEETSIAADLVEHLYEYGLREGYEPQLQLGSTDRAWIVSYHFTREDGTVFELPLIISPTATQLMTEHPNAVVITATDGKAGNRKRLRIYDDHYSPLS